ncbi:hypothetical protein MLD38_004687 [Melastoma candidum]|uniref:Uncharacterized protein n=1 Tax=Melastoma candidum TaxID=119954 RepID=A0ACB9S6G6_9MYRT|nr:hypothetical protein MLD38_004687 [Melastoma candidum]
MESDSESEHWMVIDDTDRSSNALIDPSRVRFPYCIVWSPLPVIISFIGHVGICREDGIIQDFAGPNFFFVDNFTLGAATRYIQISPEKVGTPHVTVLSLLSLCADISLPVCVLLPVVLLFTRYL